LTVHVAAYPGAHLLVVVYDPGGRPRQVLDNSQSAGLPAWMPGAGQWSIVVRDLTSAPGTAWRVDVAVAPAPLVVTTWVRDPSVTAGPYPGYRPRLTALNHGMVASARAVPDPNGPPGSWVVDASWNANGTALFAGLTAAASGSCPGQQDCPERHLSTWAGLTQDDVDHWNDRAGTVCRPVSDGGDLVNDPEVLSPITAGKFQISGNFSQQDATNLANWLAPRG
jgi:hypothetical protein